MGNIRSVNHGDYDWPGSIFGIVYPHSLGSNISARKGGQLQMTMLRVKAHSAGGTKVSWGVGHRTGSCVDCHVKFETYDTGRVDTDGGPVMVKLCPICRGGKGELICRQLKRGRWFNYFLGKVEDKRCRYCEAHRLDPNIPQSFRWGSYSWSSILFIIKLKLVGVWRGV